MQLRHLEIVWALLASSSMREAARALGVSQPAVSQALKHAEDLAGFEFFIRRKGRLVPSPELRALMPEIERVFGGVGEIRRRTAAMARGQAGRLTIASIPASTGAWFAQAVAAYRLAHPRVTIKVISGPARLVVEHVENRDADLGLLHGPFSRPGIQSLTIAHSDIVAVVNPRHPLASKAVVDIRDLATVELISLGSGNAAGDLVEQAFRRARTTQHVAAEVTAASVAITLVRAGVGVALVDARSAETFGAEGIVVRPLSERLVLQAVAIIVSRPQPHVAAFINLLRQVAGEGGAR